MENFILHIGTPRTGTTTLQKCLFPKCLNNIILSKTPYHSSGISVDKKKGVIAGDIESINTYLDNVISTNEFDNYDFADTLIFIPFVALACNPIDSQLPKKYLPVAIRTIKYLHRLSITSRKKIFISSERLCDTAASLVCMSSHRELDVKYPLFALCETINKILAIQPLISVCLRNPIDYLKSKYLRTVMQRNSMELRFLTPLEYISKQSKLERNSPGTSVLAPAIHKQFLVNLKNYGKINAFGFQNLLHSEDVFSLLGLPNEKNYSFKSFPHENKLPFSNSDQQEVRDLLIKALKNNGFLEIILSSQLYE